MVKRRRGQKSKDGKARVARKSVEKSGPKKVSVSARQLVELLLAKHSKDIAVPECKVGPTQSVGGHVRRFDLWVMRKSYSRPAFIGYEVKVNRSDFIRDEKWREYLDDCSEFSFVCPPGVIEKDEVPEEAGLIVSSTNGKRLYTKKKAPHRVIEPPVSLLLYVLMSRTNITREWYKEGKREKWEAWLKERDEKKELGYNVSKKIRELVKERIEKAEKEVKEARSKVEAFSEVEAWLQANDIEATSWSFSTHTLDRLLEEHERGFTSETLSRVAESIKSLQDVYRILTGDDPDPRERSVRGMRRLRRRVRGDEVEGDEVDFGSRVRVPTIQVEREE